jgi:hypothetical protein
VTSVVTTEKSASFSTSQYEASELVTRQEARKQDRELGLGAQKKIRGSAGEKLTQCVYSKIETVISNCKFRLTIYPINRA